MLRTAVVLLLALGGAFPLSSLVARATGPEKPQIKYTQTDQAAAGAVAIRRSDLPGTGWKGGRVKPQLGPDACPTYHPKQADLVVTGAAESDFQRGAYEFDGTVQLMRTPKMVALDWQRTVVDPHVIPCERRAIARALGSDAKVESFRRIAFPHVAQYAREFRALFTVAVDRQRVRLVADVILIGRGRFEMSVDVIGPAADKAALVPVERKLARQLVARMHT